jgi:DNA-binding NtrC family response regulator
MKTVVIFDDDEDILSICAYILGEQGWDVRTFTDCKEIIPRLDEIRPAVILMDNWIPDEGGVASTQLIKTSEALCHIPVIYFSANSDIALLAEQAGASAYLAKPFDLDELDRVLAGVVS